MSFQNMKRFSLGLAGGLMVSLLMSGSAALADDETSSTPPTPTTEIIAPDSTLAPRDVPLTAKQKALIGKAEIAINAIQSLSARFIQAASTGDMAEGKVFLAKPGRLRIEYDPPIPVLVIANHGYFTFIDQEMEQRSYLSLDNTPAGVLLRKSVNLTDDDIRVVDVQDEANIATIVVTSKSDPTIGKLSLVFSQKPFAFRQWRVTDAQGITTTVTLQNMQTGVSLADDLFVVPRADS